MRLKYHWLRETYQAALERLYLDGPMKYQDLNPKTARNLVKAGLAALEKKLLPDGVRLELTYSITEAGMQALIHKCYYTEDSSVEQKEG